MITLEHVSQSFGQRVVLREVTFRFHSDTTYVLQGPSGSGKSTILNLVAGYLKPDAGQVAANGLVEYLMQDELLFSELTVLENLQIRARARAQNAHETTGTMTRALERLGLGGREYERVATLSGGERRRVELAGTLLGDPAVLLLDEPTANLDAASSREVYSALSEISQGLTVVVVTHEHSPTIDPAAVHLELRNHTLKEA